MKKVVLLFISLVVLIPSAKADELINRIQEKKEVSLINCLSSTTSWFSVDGKVRRIRLLAYDSEDGELNQEIDNYACSLLKGANKIEVEYDAKALKKDKYNRELAWIYVDGKLLQEELIEKGFGQVNYVNSEYKYLDNLCESEKSALTNLLGIWNYPNIKEKYCKSGVTIKNNQNYEEEQEEEKLIYDVKNLYYLLFINSGIVLLALLLVKRG